MSTAARMEEQSPSRSRLALSLPSLRLDQLRIAKTLARDEVDTVVLAMGRRWGKTVLGGTISVSSAARGAHVAWVVPVYKNGRPLWRWAKLAVAGIRRAGMCRVNEAERTIEFDERVGGGFLGIYAADQEHADAMRGEAFHVVVIDEASRIPVDAWNDAIQPTLADYGGKALLISTPRGRNWFWRLWSEGQDAMVGSVRSFTAPSSDNPNPRIQAAAEKARERVPDATYRQEWLAEFLDDGGGAFQGVDAVLTSERLKAPTRGADQYIMGVDLAKSQDYTVCAVMDLRTRRQVALERWNRCEWPLTKARIITLAKLWNNARVFLDATGLGDPIYDDLVRAQLRIEAYKITTTTRQPLLENLVLLIEQGRVALLPDTTQTNELKAMERVRLPSGLFRFTTPEPLHDDCVFALALACLPLSNDYRALPAEAVEQLRIPVSALGGGGIYGRKF